MKTIKTTLAAATVASFFICSAPIAGAQDLADSINTEVTRDDDSGKWGLLGLLGLLGLIGLKRKDHDHHHSTTTGR